MNAIVRPVLLNAAVLLFAGATSVSARDLSVGIDSSCTHSTLHAALRDAATQPGRATPLTIRLARNAEHAVSSPLPDGVMLAGGYSSCADQHPLGRTPVRMEQRWITPEFAADARSHRIDLRSIQVGVIVEGAP